MASKLAVVVGVAALVAAVNFFSAPVTADPPAIVCTPGTASMPPVCNVEGDCQALGSSPFGPSTRDFTLASGGSCSFATQMECEDAEVNYWVLDVELIGGSGDDAGDGWFDCGDEPQMACDDVTPSEPQCRLTDDDFPSGSVTCGIFFVDNAPDDGELTVTCEDPVGSGQSLTITML